MDNLTLNSIGFIGKLKSNGYSQTKRMDYYCHLCRGDFKDPRLLQCYHSFCRPCLDDYLVSKYDDGKFGCPLCKEKSVVPVNGARGLPKNKYVKQSTDAVKTLYCDNCLIESKAKATCTDCDKNLCKICLVNHSSKRGSRSHNVVPVENNKEGLTMCSTHRNQELMFYCDVCEVPICTSCNSTEHKFHPCRDISSTCIVLREQLGSSLQKLGLNREAEYIAQKVNEQKRTLQIHQEDIISAIDEREKELHRMITEIRTQLVSKIVKENESDMTKLQNDIDEANTNASAAGELLRFGSLFLKQADDIEIITNTADITKQAQKLANSKCEVNAIKPSNFYPSSLCASDIEMQLIFGTLDKTPKRPKEIKSISKLDQFRRSLSGEVERSVSDPLCYSANRDRDSVSFYSIENGNKNYEKTGITCTDSTITGIEILSDGSICACLGFESLLEIYSSSGRRKSKIRFRHQVDDVVAKSNNTLYVSSNSDKRIYKVVNDRKEIFAETRSCVRGLTLGRNGSLIACMTKRGSFLEEQGEGCIMKITKDNNIEKIFEHNKLTYPARVAIGQNQRIVISDWIKMSIFICENGRIVSTYYGCKDTRTEKEFVPRGVCCLSNGDIVVLNFSSNSLHWLTPNGSLKRIIPLNSHDCWSLAVDHDDTIWIGTNHGYIFPVELL